MSKTILNLMEDRVRALMLATTKATEHVAYKEEVIKSATPHRALIERGRLIAARLDLAIYTGRLEEATSNWELIKAHEGERIS